LRSLVTSEVVSLTKKESKRFEHRKRIRSEGI